MMDDVTTSYVLATIIVLLHIMMDDVTTVFQPSTMIIIKILSSQNISTLCPEILIASVG
jgi:replicative DNA helicase